MSNQPSIMIAVDQAAFQHLVDQVERLTRAIERVNMTPRSPWITLPEYAAHVGKSEKTVRNWAREGRVDSRREGSTLMIKAP